MKTTIRTSDLAQRRPAGATTTATEVRRPVTHPMVPPLADRLSERALGFAARVGLSPRATPSAARPPVEATRPAAGHAGPAIVLATRVADQGVEAPPPKPPPGFHVAVTDFKRQLIEATLTQLSGNRTRAARALGLQRTYLLRLMREFEINVPATPGHPRRRSEGQIPLPPRPG